MHVLACTWQCDIGARRRG